MSENPMTVLRPLSEWQEDDGEVLWCRVPINEPPFVSTPLSSDWRVETANGRCIEVDDYDEDEPFRAWATHWCRLPRVSIGANEMTTSDRAAARDDLIRVVVGQQWAVAIATMMCARPKPAYLAAVLSRLPCAVDVVDGLG